MITQAVILFILLNFCHFLADYTPLSNKWMLDAKKYGKPIHPIFMHAWVHMNLMLVVLIFFTPNMGVFYASILQLISHTIFDTLKGRLAKWVPITADNTQKWYWIVMGFDQFLHQTVIALMIYILLK